MSREDVLENEINKLEEEKLCLKEQIKKLDDKVSKLKAIVPFDGDFIVEPILHSHITDCLPEDHPLAHEPGVRCNFCQTLVHAPHNECMETWIETGKGNFCISCWWDKIKDCPGALEDEWGLNQ